MYLNKYFTTRVDFLTFSFFIVISIALAMVAYIFGGIDFGVYYAAGKVFLHGGNPYDYSQLIGEIVSSTGDTNNPYYYAPWFTWVLSLFSLFPYEIARLLWALFNYGVWMLCLFNLTKLIPWHSVGWKRWGMYIYLTFVFAWSTWGSEQVGILILFIFTSVLLSYQNKQWLIMGLWIAILLFKPNITAIPIVIFSCWLLLHGNWKPVVSGGVWFIVLFLISLVLSPGWYAELLQPDKITGLSYTLDESGRTQIERFTTTLIDWLSIYGIVGDWAYTIYGIAAVVGVIWLGQLIYYSQSLLKMISASILINFALVPYALFYDYPSLSLTLFYINYGFAKRQHLVWFQRLMNICIVVCLFIGDDIRYRYWINGGFSKKTDIYPDPLIDEPKQ
jgi:hypothetical protein